jgi:enoyl-CoA hydratase
MPETGIGFFPDVGGTYFLPRCPGAVGTWLGLTGSRLGAADCIEAGIGTAFVPSARLDALAHRLAETGDPAVIAEFAERPEGDKLSKLRPAVDRCFGGDTVHAVLVALTEEGSGFAAEQGAALATKSPFAVHVTFEQLRRGRDLDFGRCMQLEYRLVHRVLVAGDFIEGVRALIIDKDKRPRWRHPDLDAVPAAEVQAAFAPLADGDLPLDWSGL